MYNKKMGFPRDEGCEDYHTKHACNEQSKDHTLQIQKCTWRQGGGGCIKIDRDLQNRAYMMQLAKQ